SNGDKFNDKFNNIEDSDTKTCSSNGNEFNNEFEDEDTEISIVRDEDANNIITKLLQAVPEGVSADINNNTIDSDSNSESEFEVEVDKGHSMSSEMLGAVIKQLKKNVADKESKQALL
ncbi:9141_t:CDS:2, partial [Racocetra fulgida]